MRLSGDFLKLFSMAWAQNYEEEENMNLDNLNIKVNLGDNDTNVLESPKMNVDIHAVPIEKLPSVDITWDHGHNVDLPIVITTPRKKGRPVK